MASQSLARIFFPILRKTDGDSGRSIKDPLGFFSCNLNAARFLDIDKLSISLPVIQVKRKGGSRSVTLADGTTLTQTTAGANIAESVLLLPTSAKGSRTVILKTGKKITDTKRIKNPNAAYHTISFRFPGFATAVVISEALGEIIPADKMKNPPNATDVWPYFIIKGGRRYPIMLGTDAETSIDADVAESPAEVEALAAKAENVKAVKKGAG